jgi:DNA polymerase III alpha subunit
MVCNYVRFRARSAVRDVGRVLGLDLGVPDPDSSGGLPSRALVQDDMLDLG